MNTDFCFPSVLIRGYFHISHQEDDTPITLKISVFPTIRIHKRFLE